MDNEKATPKMSLWSVHFVLLILANCLVGACMFFHNAVTSKYVIYLGSDESYAGIMLACFTIVATIMRIVSGGLLDKRGRRKIILIGLVIYAAATASITTGWLPYLPVARAIQAVGYSMATTGFSVALVDVLPLPKMGEGIGYSGLATSLASAVGPGIAMWIYGISKDYRVVYYASVGLLAVSFILTFICRYEKDQAFFERKAAYELAVMGDRARKIEQKEEKGSLLSRAFEKEALPSMFVSLFLSLGTGAVVAFIMTYADTINVAKASLFFTLQAVTTVLSRLVFSKMTDKYPPLVTIIPGVVVSGIAYYMLVHAGEAHVLFYIAGALLGLGAGMYTPPLNAEAVRYVPQSRRGAASATFFISMDIGVGIGGVLWGSIIKNSGYTPVFVGCVICTAISLLLSFVFFARKKEQPAAPANP